MANTLNYLDIKTVVVSCGTCLDKLMEYEFGKIFPDCLIIDIHEYLLRKGISLGSSTESYVYHDPCHSPIKNYNAVSLTATLLGGDTVLTERCCGEAGTLGTARPDIANQLRFRKLQEINKSVNQLGGNNKVKLVTTCPACQQGLSRYVDETGLTPSYIVVELAEKLLGRDWKNSYLKEIKDGSIEQVLL
jgi:Fe-S oxidoreductase